MASDGCTLAMMPGWFWRERYQQLLTVCVVHMLAAWREARATCAAAALVLLLLLLRCPVRVGTQAMFECDGKPDIPTKIRCLLAYLFD